ncbi:MAG: hypothetical protein HGA78_00005, partial [Nitrospirales bacterium]|nr:hypothetical protein [Nitrospirales bacterium]
MMKEKELNTQVFKTAAQWGSGIFYRLEEPKDGGCSIPAFPSVLMRLDPIPGIGSPLILAADCCGILYLLDSRSEFNRMMTGRRP